VRVSAILDEGVLFLPERLLINLHRNPPSRSLLLHNREVRVWALPPLGRVLTTPAHPRQLLVSPSVEFMASEPQAFASRSMLRRLQRRSPRIPAFASMSSESGSIPFWLITTKFSSSLHTLRLNSMIWRTLSSVTWSAARQHQSQDTVFKSPCDRPAITSRAC